MDFKEIMIKTVKDDEKRINHILYVVKRALELGKIYQADLHVLEVAALLHDVTKNFTKEEQQQLIKDETFTLNTPFNLWHARSAKVFAENLGIKDEKILEAIEFHIYGKKAMNLETMILVVADYTEETRTHKTAKDVYLLALKDIKKAYLLMLEEMFKYLTKNNQTIVKEQFEIYEYYKKEKQNGITE